MLTTFLLIRFGEVRHLCFCPPPLPPSIAFTAAVSFFLLPTSPPLRFLLDPLRVTRAPRKPPLLRQMVSSLLLAQKALHRELTPSRSMIRLPMPLPPIGLPVRLTTVALPSSGRISTRTRGRTAVVVGTAPPAVEYGFGPGGAPRPPVRRVNTPPRAPRPGPPPVVVAAPAPALSPVPAR